MRKSSCAKSSSCKEQNGKLFQINNINRNEKSWKQMKKTLVKYWDGIRN